MYWHHIRTVLQIFDCKFLLFVFVLSSFHIIHFGYRFSARAFVCISKWNITAIQRQQRSDFLFSCLSFSLHHRFNQRLIIISGFRRFCRMKYGTYGLHSLNFSDMTFSLCIHTPHTRCELNAPYIWIITFSNISPFISEFRSMHTMNALRPHFTFHT